MKHTQVEKLTFFIDYSRRYHQNFVVTLLDLRNAALCEVDHDFIQAVLSLHHISRDNRNLIPELYKDYRIESRTNIYITSPVKVGKEAVISFTLNITFCKTLKY